MRILIGDTGLVGSTFMKQLTFDQTYNSKNIHTFNDNVKDGAELWLTCLPATKWLVNQNPHKDLQNIYSILEIISKKSYSKIYLFSTIDVYCDSPLGVDEDYSPNVKDLSYGTNRYLFEVLVKELVCTKDLVIVRLPALYNNSIKKNIIYDLLNNNNVDKINTNSAYQWLDLDAALGLAMAAISLNPQATVYNLFPPPIETSYITSFFPQYKIPESQNRIQYDYKTKYNPTGYILGYEYSLISLGLFINAAVSK